MIARQWFKHAVGSTYAEEQNGWNESSRRYVTENEEFYTPGPHEWRSKPENSKQGSGAFLPAWPVEAAAKANIDVPEEVYNDPSTGQYWMHQLNQTIADGQLKYEQAMDAGIAPEQARLFLPANGLYVRFYWTVSLAGLLHFLDLRDEAHAQHEIQLYAKALRELAEPVFPRTFEAYAKRDDEK
jgi:thymidylate synthase (FAD)